MHTAPLHTPSSSPDNPPPPQYTEHPHDPPTTALLNPDKTSEEIPQSSSSRPYPRNSSAAQPLGSRAYPLSDKRGGGNQRGESSDSEDDDDFQDWGDDDPQSADMPSDLRPPFHRPTDGRSQTPLLTTSKGENGYATGSRPGGPTRKKSTFHERDPDEEARKATRKRYTYAAFFLVVSLISFTIQTETAVYIKKHLKWKKSYAML